MGKISDRIDGYVEKKRKTWGQPLGNFVAGIFEGIGDRYIERNEPEILATVHDALDRLSKNPHTPAEVKKIAVKLNGKRAGWMIIVGLVLLPFILIPMVTAVFQPLGRMITYTEDRFIKSYRDNPDNITRLFHIDPAKYEYLFSDLRDQGWGEDKIEYIKELAKVRLDPDTISRVWLRDKDAWSYVWKDLKDQGWTDERIAVIQELAHIIPPLPDMVRFADFSAFDESVIKEWQAQYEAPGWITKPFSLLGVRNDKPWDWANKYWFSHWTQPGRYDIADIFRRGLMSGRAAGESRPMTDAEIEEGERVAKLTFLTQGFSSYWQPKMTELLKEIPTRVDVRRWWDMRTIDEARLRQLYQAMGYFGKDLEDYVLWTKVYVAWPDLVSRWQNGWISLDELKSELSAMGMPGDRIEELVQTKIKAAQPERTSAERDITKTDIIKGVKQGVITRSEGAELLVDMGYSEDEAVYILEINIPEDNEDQVVEQRLLSKSDILKGLKEAIITREDAGAKLADLRYSPADVEYLLKLYDAQVKPPTEPRLKEASKADIVLGVKKGLITPEEGYNMLLDIGFADDAAEFILMVKAEASPFSPRSLSEFKSRAELYKRTVGQEVKPMSEELKKAADKLVELTGEVEALDNAVKEEEARLVPEEDRPAGAEKKLKALQVKRNRARAELERAQLEYNKQVAEWKHGGE